MTLQAATSTSLHWCKFLALHIIIFGHFFTDVLPVMWIPAGASLLIFGFASGYTGSASLYKSRGCMQYWWYKLSKFYPSFWVLNLCVLLMTQQWPTQPMALWHTLCHMLGGTGLLSWAGVKNQSVLGSALWFLTVLLLSWLCAPFLKRWYQHPWALRSIIPSAVLLAVWAMLWQEGLTLALTVWGFYVGSIMGAHHIPIPIRYTYWLKQWVYIIGVIGLLCLVLAIPLKPLVAVGLILAQACAMLYICGNGWLSSRPHLAIYTSQLAWPFYILHPYVKIHLFNTMIVNYIVSLGALCVMGILFCWGSNFLSKNHRA